jgi:lipopolysaccharide biosynthesis protein
MVYKYYMVHFAIYGKYKNHIIHQLYHIIPYYYHIIFGINTNIHIPYLYYHIYITNILHINGEYV